MLNKDRKQLAELMVKFNTMNGNITAFHAEWQIFIESLSKKDAAFATQVMFDTMMNNVKELRHLAVELCENGTESNRQFVTESAQKLMEHSAFDKKYVTA